MSRAFTQLWKNETWEAHGEGRLDHSASNGFLKAGGAVGDAVFIVTVKDGKLLLAGELKVDEVLSLNQARRRFGTCVRVAAQGLSLGSRRRWSASLTAA
jgi:hypothetical protein